MKERESSHEKILRELEKVLHTPDETISQFFDLGDIQYHFQILTYLQNLEEQAKAEGLLTPDSKQKILDFKIKIYKGMVDALYEPKNKNAPAGLLKSLELLREDNVSTLSQRKISSSLVTLEKIFLELEQLNVDVTKERAIFEPIKKELEDLLLQQRRGSPETYKEMYPELVVSGKEKEKLQTLRRMGYTIGKYMGEIIPIKGTLTQQIHMNHLSDGVVFPLSFGTSDEAQKIQSLRTEGRDVVGVILDHLNEEGEITDAVCYLAERNADPVKRKGIENGTEERDLFKKQN